jgi:hypothetical protein
MALPESGKLPHKLPGPLLGTWQRLVTVLTSTAAVAAFTLWSVYAGLGKDVPLSDKLLIVSLVVAIAVIVALFDQLRLAHKEYQKAVEAIYENHPVVGKGIDIQHARPIINTAYRDFDVLIRIDQMENKVLFFTCVGNISHIDAFVKPPGERLYGSVPRGEPGRVTANLFTRNMFEIDPKGQAGNLCLRIDDADLRIASIEWRDAQAQKT